MKMTDTHIQKLKTMGVPEYALGEFEPSYDFLEGYLQPGWHNNFFDGKRIVHLNYGEKMVPRLAWELYAALAFSDVWCLRITWATFCHINEEEKYWKDLISYQVRTIIIDPFFEHREIDLVSKSAILRSANRLLNSPWANTRRIITTGPGNMMAAIQMWNERLVAEWASQAREIEI